MHGTCGTCNTAPVAASHYMRWLSDHPLYTAHLQEEGADGHEVRLLPVLQWAVGGLAAALQPLGAHRHLAGVVHEPAALPVFAPARPTQQEVQQMMSFQ